jgi:hypothetical protein
MFDAGCAAAGPSPTARNSSLGPNAECVFVSRMPDEQPGAQPTDCNYHRCDLRNFALCCNSILITGGLTPPMQKAPVAPPGFSLRAGFFIDHMGACLS